EAGIRAAGSKRLADADVDLEVRVALAPVQRDGYVRADWPERQIVAKARADGIADVRKVGRGFRADRTGVDEDHRSQITPDVPPPDLQAGLEQGGAAHGRSVLELGADALVVEAPHRAPAP